MGFGGTADLNWHHKENVLLDMKWVNKTLVVHVDMRQFEEEDHQGHPPSIILTRKSPSKTEDLVVVSGRAGTHLLVSLDHQDKLIGRINQANPNSAGTVKWEIIA